MGYVQAGYSIVLAILFLYALTLVFRRRRLTRAVALLVDAPPADGHLLSGRRRRGRGRVPRRGRTGPPARTGAGGTGPDARGGMS